MHAYYIPYIPFILVSNKKYDFTVHYGFALKRVSCNISGLTSWSIMHDALLFYRED